MNASKPLALAMLIGITAFSASAQTAAEHTQHHPDGAAAPAQAVPATPEQQMAAMDKQLQLMRDMSRKLADAKTPQERQAMMAEHQKTMQDSMKMMGQMQGMPMGGMGMMSGQMMGGAGMSGSSTTPPSAPASGTSAPGMGPQMMGQMMQRHALMEKRMDMMQSMMQMMMDRLPATPTK